MVCLFEEHRNGAGIYARYITRLLAIFAFGPLNLRRLHSVCLKDSSSSVEILTEFDLRIKEFIARISCNGDRWIFPFNA